MHELNKPGHYWGDGRCTYHHVKLVFHSSLRCRSFVRRPTLKEKICRFNPKWSGYCGVRYGLGEEMLDLTFGPVARDLGGLKLKIPVHEGYIMYDECTVLLI